MNINSIKSDTPVTSFINVSQVEDETKKQLGNLEKVLDNLRNLMDNQVRTGGLSINAYTIGGEAPLITGGNGVKVSAKTIYDDLDNLEANIKSLKSSIPNKAKAHKLEEYEVLKNKVTARINALEETKKIKQKAYDAATDPATKSTAKAALDKIIDEIETCKKTLTTCNDKIKRYS